jgi:hypothetical protein
MKFSKLKIFLFLLVATLTAAFARLSGGIFPVPLMAGMIALLLVDGLVDGEIPYGGSLTGKKISRQKAPKIFWGAMICYACFLGILLLFGFSGVLTW